LAVNGSSSPMESMVSSSLSVWESASLVKEPKAEQKAGATLQPPCSWVSQAVRVSQVSGGVSGRAHQVEGGDIGQAGAGVTSERVGPGPGHRSWNRLGKERGTCCPFAAPMDPTLAKLWLTRVGLAGQEHYEDRALEWLHVEKTMGPAIPGDTQQSWGCR
jgi:hypothetical protein